MKLKFEISEDFIKKCSIYKDLKYWILLVNWGVATRWGGPLGREPRYSVQIWQGKQSQNTATSTLLLKQYLYYLCINHCKADRV